MPIEEAWPEAAEFNRNVVDSCLRNQALSYRDITFLFSRGRSPEELWLDLHYSPVVADNGLPGGALAIVVDSTERVIAERGRRSTEDAYRETNERLQFALNSGAVVSHTLLKRLRKRSGWPWTASESKARLPGEPTIGPAARNYNGFCRVFSRVIRKPDDEGV